MKQLTDREILSNAVSLVELRLRAAGVAQREAEEAQARPARLLSAKAWLTCVLRQAGVEPSATAKLRDILRERGAQFPKLASYVAGIEEAIAQNEWRSPPEALQPAPYSWRCDRDGAMAEAGTLGMSLWVAVAVAVQNLAARRPEAFGDLDDARVEEIERTKPIERAREAMDLVREAPIVLLFGIATLRGVSIEPKLDLPERLVADVRNPDRRRLRAQEPAGLSFLA